MNLKKSFAAVALVLSMGATSMFSGPALAQDAPIPNIGNEMQTQQQQQLPSFQELKSMLMQAVNSAPDVQFKGMTDRCEGLALEKQTIQGLGEAFVITPAPDGRAGTFPQIESAGQTLTMCLTPSEFQEYIQMDNQRLQQVAQQIEILRQVAQTYTPQERDEILDLVDQFQNKIILSVHARNQAFSELMNSAPAPRVQTPESQNSPKA
jgi:hypothetical protein